jgi:hypothetical protein
MVKYNIETAWMRINELTKAPVYYDRDKSVLFYGMGNNDDAQYYVATMDYLHLPEISPLNRITFTRPVAWDSVTEEDIKAIARALNVVTGIMDLRPLYAADTTTYIYHIET